MTGWAFADAAEGKVAAMFLEDYGTDRFVSAYEKGCFRHDILTAWSMENAEKPVNADYRESCRYLPQIEVDEALWGQRVPSYREYITSPSRMRHSGRRAGGNSYGKFHQKRRFRFIF